MWIEGDGADGVGGLFVEQRRPGGAGVVGTPDPAGPHGYKPGGGIVRLNLDMRDAPRHEGGADVSQGQAFKGFLRPGAGLVVVVCIAPGGKQSQKNEQTVEARRV